MTMRTNMSKNKDKNSEIPISIVVVGDSHCGKTQLINKFQNFNFSKVYNPTGFNKIEKVVKYNQTDVKLTVWDTSGVATYSSLRPLVYRECSVVLVCYSDSGVNGLDTWIQEVRHSTSVPIVLAHTKNDETEPGMLDMKGTCLMCERLGAAGWETCSASSGDNVNMVFDLCISAAMEAPSVTTRKDRLVRPNTLKLSSLSTTANNNKNTRTTRVSKTSTSRYSEHVYENPEEIDNVTVRLRKPIKHQNHVITRQMSVSPDSVISGHSSDDTRNLFLRTIQTDVDQSVFTPQSTKSIPPPPSRSALYSPTPSELDGVPMRPHSSQSACIRPSRLYRHSAHVSRDHRMSQDMQQPSSRLKPVPIPMSPNCDINHNSRIQPHHQDRFSRMSGIHSDTASILSPTESTVSSLLSIPVFPGYRTQSDTSSVSAMASVYSDHDSVSSVHGSHPQYTHYKSYNREKKKDLCSIM